MMAGIDSCWRLTVKKSIAVISQFSIAAFVMMTLFLQHHAFAAEEIIKGALQDQAKDSTEELNNQRKVKDQIKKAESDSVDTLPEVSVKDTRVKEDSGINSTQSITTITPEQLQRSQFNNIFEAVRSVPGVSTSGGPRASGMIFSIRGFADGEDVMVKVDGAPKAFEKYRMGGTFVEPELLRSIEVQRGPQIGSGSGALGGTIIAQTKNAADFLKPGQKVGAKAKFGYGNNNDEYSRSYMLYTRPNERVDILYNYSNRQSNNITLADKTKLDSSAIESISELLKVSLFPTDSLEVITSLVKFTDTGLQPFDTTGGQPGSFGNVIRSTDDFSWTETFNYTPDNPWVNFKAIFAGGYTKMNDLIRPGMSSINQRRFSIPLNIDCRGTINIRNLNDTTSCQGDLNDYYLYKTKTIDFTNTAILTKTQDLELSLLTGWQYNSREREVERFFENRNSNDQVNRFPNGYNSTAPSGDRAFRAFYMQPNIQLGQLNIRPGYRRDDYEVVATGLAKETLDGYEKEHKVKFTEETFSLGLAYDLFTRNSPQQLTIYSNYAQGFKPPLIDEYFGDSIFGPRCISDENPSGICGDLYKPQTSESTEAGISYQNPHIWGTDLFLRTKLNFYHIHTANLLISKRYDESSNTYPQDGWERRNGVEFESFLQYQTWYARGSYSRIKGDFFNGLTFAPLYTVPGNALNINIGKEISSSIDVNLTYRKISERNVLLLGDGINSAYRFGTQDGYELWNAGISWRATPNLTMRLIGENLTNNQYRFDSAFGGLGILGPGRNVKFFAELIY
jgi:hemoglobin/transferrin/lactoferrin receptor protein